MSLLSSVQYDPGPQTGEKPGTPGKSTHGTELGEPGWQPPAPLLLVTCTRRRRHPQQPWSRSAPWGSARSASSSPHFWHPGLQCRLPGDQRTTGGLLSTLFTRSQTQDCSSLSEELSHLKVPQSLQWAEDCAKPQARTEYDSTFKEPTPPQSLETNLSLPFPDIESSVLCPNLDLTRSHCFPHTPHSSSYPQLTSHPVLSPALVPPASLARCSHRRPDPAGRTSQRMGWEAAIKILSQWPGEEPSFPSGLGRATWNNQGAANQVGSPGRLTESAV